MTKVGIITIVRVNDYGKELQVYATQEALRKQGYDAEIIDYLFYKNKGHKKTKASRPTFKMPLKKYLAEWLYPKHTRLKALLQRNKLMEMRGENFVKFHIHECEHCRTIYGHV